MSLRITDTPSARVHLITGQVNQGKTTAMMNLYDRTAGGAGVLTLKVYQQQQLLGYDLLLLPERQSVPFIRPLDNLPVDWNAGPVLGPWSFAGDAFRLVENRCDQWWKNKVPSLFLDEVGPLELQDKGFAPVVRQILSMNSEVYITVREKLLQVFLRKFKIRTYDVHEYWEVL